jgi:hypothetical protein
MACTGVRVTSSARVVGLRFGAAVGARVEELGGQVAMARDDLNAVQVGGLKPPGGGRIPILDLADELDRHVPRPDVKPLVGHRGRRQGDRGRTVL